MSDIRRIESGHPGDAAERDSRAEALLVEGLDRYFNGQYEDAIHVWTRVLFLDRSHARARAYIDRARTALGERQRRADEMLHATEQLVGAGDLPQARALLSQASRTTGDDERVARLWTEIERVERSRAGTPAPAITSAVVDAVPVQGWRHAARSFPMLLGAAAVGALLVTLVTSPVVRGWFGGGGDLQSSSTMVRPPAPPVLSRTEVALVRARTLYARGRLADALRALDELGPSPADRRAVDALRVEIQEVLLATKPAPAASPLAQPGAGRP